MPVERELASGELVQSFDLCASTGRGYYLCTRNATDGKNVVEVFVRWIVEVVRAAVADGGERIAG